MAAPPFAVFEGWEVQPQAPQQAAGEALLERLQDHRRIGALRFTEEQMDVLGHDYVSYNHDSVASAHLLEGAQGEITIAASSQYRGALITAGGDEME